MLSGLGTMQLRMKRYWTKSENIIEFIAPILYVIALILAVPLPIYLPQYYDEGFYITARILYSLAVMMFFLRILQFYTVLKSIGPLIVVFRKMVFLIF